MTTRPSEADLQSWWTGVTTTALFGTARRDPPATPDGLPSRADASPEIALLDAAAIGGALVRAGRHTMINSDLPTAGAEPATADPDERIEPTARARQLLELIMTQSPAGARLQRPLLRHWLQSASESGHRIPHRWLPRVIELGRRDSSLRVLIMITGDARGRWLGGLDADWAWMSDDPDSPVDPQQWARQSTAVRVDTVRRLRDRDPAAARELIASTLPTDGAQDRNTLLGCLMINLGPDDESLLEQALDDRSTAVRTTAGQLLDGLDGSARASRMADRLAALLTFDGGQQKLIIDLPAAPSDAAIRDGLGRPPTRRSERGYWLERLAAGAPLALWTSVTGRDPARSWQLITDDDARRGVLQAALARHDRDWARALAPQVNLPALYRLLPAEEWDPLAAQAISRLTTLPRVRSMIESAPAPWGPDFSRAALDTLVRLKGRLAEVVEPMALGLHPSALGRLTELATGAGDFAAREAAGNLTQYLTLTTEIAEALR